MRRIQLYVDEEVDHALTAAAAQTGQSRSEVMREAVRRWLGTTGEGDPVDALVGSVDAEPTEDLDAVIYDR